jgi:SAM-dependent methyltransferase
MYNDILQLMHFYGSPLGQLARRVIDRQIARIWPNLYGQRLLALGYAPPFMPALAKMAERSIIAMPATQGVAAWPEAERNLATLVDETNLPFEDFSMDRVLAIHALEGAGDPAAMLQEIWRVMAGNGQLLLIVPNRMGLWARFEHTPFGTGQPFSAGQLHWLLQQNLFTPLRLHRLLYTPPGRGKFWQAGSESFEKFAPYVCRQFGGLLAIEARKEMYSAHPQRYRRIQPALGLPVPGKYAGLSREKQNP